MAGQGLSRRKAIQYMTMAAAAAQFGGFERWSYAHEHDAPAAKPTGKPYKPQFFSKSQFVVISALTERIIPTDDSPGAREAGVAEFIDFMIFHDKGGVQKGFLEILNHVGRISSETHKSTFEKLNPVQQDEVITALMTKQKKSFDLIRNYTVMGFFNSKVGMEYLDVPFLKTWSGNTDCQHLDDPEHKKMAQV